ncbi:MAG: hypothetical protein ACR2P1_10900 [Pseudomonadales bacterium]
MRTSLIVSIALTVGALLGYFGSRYNASSDVTRPAVIKRPIAVPAPLDITLLSEEDARQQRAENYQSVRGIADILSLPTQFAQTEALVALAVRSDVNTIIELLGDARGVSPGSTQRQMLTVLLSRFAELDTPLALEYLQSSGLANKAPRLLDFLFGAWAKTNLNSALRGAQQLSDPQHIQIAGDAILQAHMEHGEELAQDIKARLPSQYNAERYAFTALTQLASSAPAEAIKKALLVKDRQMRDSAVFSIVNTWAQQDLLAATDHVLNLPDGRFKDELQQTIAQHYAKQSPATVMEWIESNFEGQQRGNMMQSALGQIAQRNPELAISFLEKLPAAQRDLNMLHNVGTAWARKDPHAAVDWINKQEQEVAATMLSLIAQEWAMRDPQAAGEYVENLSATTRQQWISSVASGYAQRDPAAALSWLQQYNTEQGYANALDNVLSQWAYSDPPAALAYIERQPDAEKFPNAIVNAMSSLAERDTAEALAKVEAMPEGRLQNAAAGALADTWANRDAQGLDNWIKTLDAGPVRDRAVVALVANLGDKPERAITLINSMQSEEARLNSGMQLLLESGAGGDKVKELTARLNLPDNKRQEIINTIRAYQNSSPSSFDFRVGG